MSSLLQAESWFDADAVNLRNSIAEFGEWFVHQPMIAKPNFGATVDASRLISTVQAIFERDAEHVKLGLSETGVSTRKLCLTVQVCDFRSNVRQKDTFRHCQTGELFEVVDYKPDGLAGAVIELTQLGRRTTA